MNEFVPGYEAESFHGISAPAGTPREIVEKLNKAVNGTLADPNVKARINQLDREVLTGSPEDYGKYLRGEIARWAKVIQFSGAKAD
jgi:tripartite-type tricarboxylate transporter receptor subunit TctC